MSRRERIRHVLGCLILTGAITALALVNSVWAGTTISNYCNGCHAYMPAWYCALSGC